LLAFIIVRSILSRSSTGTFRPTQMAGAGEA
jgi:hypothetical protein